MFREKKKEVHYMSHYCPECGAVCEDGQSYCPGCGAAQYPETTQAPEMPMKWYKFVIYFQLFANAVVNVVNAIPVFTGSLYGADSDYIYNMVSGLKILDLVYGAGMIAVAVLAIVARNQLKHFSAKGPATYYKVLILSMVLAAGYTMLSSMVISGSALGPYYEPQYTTMVSSLASSLIMLFCNKTYFGKRAHLFVNP